MGLFDPKSDSTQQASAPAQPTPAIAPQGSKPKAKKQQMSFLGTDTTPDATQQSNKTLLGQ